MGGDKFMGRMVHRAIDGSETTEDLPDGYASDPVPANAGISVGTSFPLAPTDNQLCFRTDRGILYFWDPTYDLWLSVTLYNEGYTWIQGAGGDGAAGRATIPFEGTYSIFLTRFQEVGFKAVAADWDVKLRYLTAANAAVDIATIDTLPDTGNTNVNRYADINAPLADAAVALEPYVDEVTGTSTLTGNVRLYYRLIG
jgi:hypothetical protein